MSVRTPLRNLAEYLPARLATSFISCFPAERNLATCDALSRVYARLVPRHVKRAADNLRASFPQWDEARVQRIARESIRHLLQLAAVDAPSLERSIRPCNWHRRINMDGATPSMEHLNADKPALLLTGHCGNWELMGYALSIVGYPMHALARPLDNPLLNDWLLGIRQAWGLKVLTKWGATPVMQQIIESGGRVGFIADQNAGHNGVFVPFFGRLASAYKSIALLAMHHEIPILVATARRRGQTVQYDMIASDVITPNDWQSQEDPLYYITARYTRALETLVRQCPEQYLWMHRRWKSRPRHVRRGQTMPDSLAKQIRGLPWLDEAQAARIIDTSNHEAMSSP